MGMLPKPGHMAAASATPHKPAAHTGPTGHFSGHGHASSTPQTQPPPGALPNEVADNKPAMLSEGEVVVPADVVRWHGLKQYEKMRDEAKTGLMQMAMDGRIQATGDRETHPAQQEQPAFNRGGYMSINPGKVDVINAKDGTFVEPNAGIDESIPMFDNGGYMGSNLPAPPAAAPANPSADVYNAYLQTGGKTAPTEQPFLDAQGNFNFGYSAPSGGVNATAGTASGATPGAVSSAPQPGLMQVPDAPGPSGNGMIASTTAPSNNGATSSASSTGPEGNGLMGEGAGGSGSNANGGLMTVGGGGAAGGAATAAAREQAPGGIDTQALAKDAVSLGKGLYNQVNNPDSTLNNLWDNIFGSDVNAAGAGIPGAAEATPGVADGAGNMVAADAVNPDAAIAGDAAASTAGETASAQLASDVGNLGAGAITAGAGFIGSELGSLITGGQHPTQAAIGGAIGGAVGGVALGATSGTILGLELGSAAGPIGAAAGALIGTVIGSFFGPHPSVGPDGGANVAFNGKQFYTSSSGSDNKMPGSTISSLGSAYNNTMNGILSNAGGTVSGFTNAGGASPFFQVGYFKGKYYAIDRNNVQPGPGGDYSSADQAHSYSTPDAAILAAVKQTMGQMQLKDADPYVLAAVKNSNATTVKQFNADINFAKEYQQFAQAQKSAASSGTMGLMQSAAVDPNNPMTQNSNLGSFGQNMAQRAAQLGLTNLG